MDREKTEKYYRDMKADELCDCEDCQLYYSKVRSTYPQVSQYLESLGVDIEKPLETMPLCEPDDNTMLYDGPQYVIMGTADDFQKTEVNGMVIDLTDSHPGTDIEEDHFVIELGAVFLKKE